MVSIERQSYRLSRNYALISLVAVAISSIIIFSFFRVQTIKNLERASEESYTALAVAITQSMNSQFVEFYELVEAARKNNKPIPHIQASLAKTIQRLMTDSSIVRIKIYDQFGSVVYSTKTSQIGEQDVDNAEFLSAISGFPASKLIYRDGLNFFHGEVEDANLAQSYVPIETDPFLPPIGVFEVYADMTEAITESNRTQMAILIFLVVVMGLLYTTLMFFIKKGEKIINEQQRESRERQKTLEILSSKMITAQEDEKRRLSEKLHEDIVQTILAVKVHLENCINNAKKNGQEAVALMPEGITSILQEAVNKIRAVSIDLRPPSLDNFGLVAATNTLISDFKELSDHLNIKIKIDITEESLTPEMKSILFRILKDTLGAIAFNDRSINQVNVHIAYNDIDDKLELDIEDGDPGRHLNQDYFELMRERTILSGGEFSILKDSIGNIKAHSAWNSR